MSVSDLTSQVSVRVISASELGDVIDDLARGFRDTVNGGSPLGFMPPITLEEARDYWISVGPELASGARLLVVVFHEGLAVASAQLALSKRANSPHRAVIEKVFTTPAARGRGIGTTLTEGVEQVGLQNGRTLLQLNTRHASQAQRWYERLGYVEVGVIPGWTIGPNGERYDHVEMYKELKRRQL